jgi:uncharacterized protein
MRNPGMSEETFFFDTYAIFEIIGGNPKYEKYSNCKIITTIFNLAELNYNLKKDMSKQKADDYTKDYNDFVVDVSLEDIKRAMDLKTKRRKMSIPDVIGCKELENVEFVKK